MRKAQIYIQCKLLSIVSSLFLFLIALSRDGGQLQLVAHRYGGGGGKQVVGVVVVWSV